jgi:hypothetical protein
MGAPFHAGFAPKQGTATGQKGLKHRIGFDGKGGRRFVAPLFPMAYTVANDRSGGSLLNAPSMKLTSAYAPLVLSGAALALLIGHAAIFGVVHEADEGAAAHIFQLLMVAQVPFPILFATGWLRRKPRAALGILALQLGSALVAISAVKFLT